MVKKLTVQASGGLDYSRGTKRVAPGVSKLGRTPTHGGKKQKQIPPLDTFPEQQGRAAFFG